MRYAEALSILCEVAASQQRLRRSFAGGGPSGDLRPRSEVVPLSEALGRITNEAILSNNLVPPFRNSSMDGFALPTATADHSFLTSAVVNTYSVSGALFPGDLPPAQTATLNGQPTVWEITTGAPMPFDCDRVVKVEDVRVTRDEHGRATRIELPSSLVSPAPGESVSYVRPQGEDYAPGDVVVPAGTRLRPVHMLALAAVQCSEVRVQTKPRVTLLSTGRELFEVGEAPVCGGIPNSSGAYLLATWSESAIDVQTMPILRDDPAPFRAWLTRLLVDPPDVLVTTGAVSMGSADFVREVLESLGGEILFHRVLIRPGKPILFARFTTKVAAREFVIFGLPGNPISSVVGHEFFVAPYLRELQGSEDANGDHGRSAGAPTTGLKGVALSARLCASIKKPAELRCFFRARIDCECGIMRVSILREQGSSLVRPLSDANAWAILPEGRGEFAPDDVIEVVPI